MKTNVKFNKISYCVVDEMNVVVCTITGTIMGSPFKVTGKAKCSSKDTFDEVKGRRIAESRAKKKVYKKAYLLYHNIYKSLDKQASKFSNLEGMLAHLLYKENLHIEKLCNS